MIVKEVEVLNTMPSTFTAEDGRMITYFYVSARDKDRLYLLTSKRDYNVGDIIDISYDSNRKRFTVVEFERKE